MRDDIHILLDSVSVMNETELKNDPRCHEIKLVCHLEEDQWEDGEKTLEEMFSEIEKRGVLPTTSQPPIGKFYEIFEKLAKDGKKVIAIHIGSALSGTYQAACLAARDVNKDVAGADIRVIDGLSAGPALAEIAIATLKKIDEGASMDEVFEYAKDVTIRTETFFTVSTLDYLQKGGRIGSIGSLVGNLLGIKPIAHLDKEGKIEIVDKVRTRKKAIKKMIELAGEYSPIESIAVAHGADLEKAEFVKTELENMYPDIPVLVTGIGTVLAAHLGPGVIGVFVRRKQ